MCRSSGHVQYVALSGHVQCAALAVDARIDFLVDRWWPFGILALSMASTHTKAASA
jgi:hypothetical protein